MIHDINLRFIVNNFLISELQPIENAITIIQFYIYEKTGKAIQIDNYYITPKEEEKFIKMLQIALSYYKQKFNL